MLAYQLKAGWKDYFQVYWVFDLLKLQLYLSI